MVLKPLGKARPRIIDENVEPAEPAGDRLDHRRDLVRFGDVSPDEQRLHAVGVTQEGALLLPLLGIALGDHDIGTSLGKRPDDALADPLSAPGDQGHAALKQLAQPSILSPRAPASSSRNG
jgi:hypothetical protein